VKVGIIVNTSDPETAWNALHLGSKALSTGNEVNMFLLGGGVEIENIKDGAFNVGAAPKS